MIWKLGAATIAAAILMFHPGAAGAEPYSTSDQIRASRSLAAQDALVLDVLIAGAQPGAPSRLERSVATLASTFNHTEMGADHQLDDYELCRTLTWSEGGAVSNINCHGLPHFAFIELQNRLGLSGVVASVTKDPSRRTAAYWSEANLGVAGPDAKPLQVRAAGRDMQYLYNSQVAASVSGDLGPLSPTEMKAFVRFLARHFPMHPQMRADIAAGGRLPAVIEVTHTDLSGKSQASRITIANPRRQAAEYPLPAGLPSALRAEAAKDPSPRGRALRRALAVVDSGGADGPPSFESLVNGIQQGGDRPLASLMLLLNLTQQYGGRLVADRNLLAPVRPQIGAIMRDPEVARFWTANNLAGSRDAPGDRVAAARFLAEARALDDLPFGTFRYVTYANLVGNSAGSDRWPADIRGKMPERLEDNYWRHIAAYPWAANAYADLSNLFPFDPATTWLLRDLGRAVDPDWKSSVMGGVVADEAKLRERAPDFY